MRAETRNLYIHGDHEPVGKELAVADLPIHGELPRDLQGLFARNSPDPQFAPMGRYHWFDGDGMVHGLRLEDGKASYVNKWIRTRGFELEREAGKPLWTGIMEPVNVQNPHGPLKDTANTDLVFHNGKLLATWWLSGTPYALSTKDLSTLGVEKFGGKLTGGFASHPKVDPRTGEMVFFDYSIVRPPFLRYGVVSKEGELVRYVPIDVPQPHILHDCAITERYSLLLDFPLGWDTEKLKQGKRRIGFNRDQPARIGVLPRHGDNSNVKWFEAESCYMYHSIRAYEDGDEVVLTGCRVANPIPDEQDQSGRVPRLDFIELTPRLYEWRLNMKTGGVKEQQLDDLITEFPKMNDATLGGRTRYSYNPKVASRPDVAFNGIVKYDLQTGARDIFEYDAGWVGSECVFVAREGAKEEDDGWLVTFATALAEKTSEFRVFDAKDVRAGAVARVTLPQRIPVGFHSCWVPGSAL